jgi:septum formation inhibitor MinC
MSQAPSVAFAAGNEDNLAGATANVSLRGTTRGLEILISGAPSTAALGARLTELLAEAPGFFAGSSARVAIDGALPSGALACLEEVTTRFAVQIVEISPVVARRRRSDVPVLRPEDAPQVRLAEGTGPIAEETLGLRGGESGATEAALPVLPAAPNDAAPNDAVPNDAVPNDATPIEVALANTAPVDIASVVSVPAASGDAAPVTIAPGDGAPGAVTSSIAAPSDVASSAVALATAAPSAMAAAAIEAVAAPPGPRLVIGPVRSGVIVDHVGHVIVIGDVNPGAEVRAEGSIMVLGRLRGVAHAGIGRQAGFIIALSLQPQQLRIGRVVARAADADHPGNGAEIAYATGETIVVERFLGRLPSGLAASM